MPTDRATDSTGTAWVAPVDGACPLSHPVKANANSGIYHVPGGRFYDRTRPERCYSDAGGGRGRRLPCGEGLVTAR